MACRLLMDGGILMFELTYALKTDNNSSAAYYKDICHFTDKFIRDNHSRYKVIRSSYFSYNKTYGNKMMNTELPEEFLLHYLMLGVFWKIYLGYALKSPKVQTWILKKLNVLKQKDILKQSVDKARGTLLKSIYDGLKLPLPNVSPSVKELGLLIEWLQATGEFKQEAACLFIWKQFLSQQRTEVSTEIIAEAVKLAELFEQESINYLGKYTANVDLFLQESEEKYIGREDIVFCRKKRIEYHLNMVGAEILNRVYLQEFLKQDRKMVFLPECMRFFQDNRCQASKRKIGLKCSNCTKECFVNKITTTCAENGYHMLILSHDSQVVPIAKHFKDKKIGVVGIACTLNLIEGGLKLQSLGIPAQCVLLENCGCKKHWHEKDIPTSINMDQLKRVLKICS